MTYSFGPGSVTDNSGSSGPDVFSASGIMLEVNLIVPALAAGSTVQVTTAGGSATLNLASVTTPTVAAEPQGNGAVDGVGNTLATAVDLAMGTNSLLTVTGRINTAPDVDMFHLVGATGGSILSLSATGAQAQFGYPYFRLFDDTGAELGSFFQNVTNFVLPIRNAYYLGYSGYPNTAYNAVTGAGTSNAFTAGDYSLNIRFSAPGATSLTGISATAASGNAAATNFASANTEQTITLQGSGFSAATRVRFSVFDSHSSPQNGVTEREVMPTSVAADGLSLQVAVPPDALTGLVRLAEEPGGLLLQIVPTLTSVVATSGFYSDGANLQLTGSGYIEGAEQLLLDTAVVQDVWMSAGPDSYGVSTNIFRNNAQVNYPLPTNPSTGPRGFAPSAAPSRHPSAIAERSRAPLSRYMRTRSGRSGISMAQDPAVANAVI